jgi:hypothetical protein
VKSGIGGEECAGEDRHGVADQSMNLNRFTFGDCQLIRSTCHVAAKSRAISGLLPFPPPPHHNQVDPSVVGCQQVSRLDKQIGALRQCRRRNVVI